MPTDQIDIAGIMEKTGAVNASAAITGAAVLEEHSTAASSYFNTSDILVRDAALTSSIAAQQGDKVLRAENSVRELAQVMGADLESRDNILAVAGQQFRDSYLKSVAKSKEIAADDAETGVANTIVNFFTRDGKVRDMKESYQDASMSLEIMQKVDATVLSSKNAQLAINGTLTADMIAKQQELVGNAALKLSNDAVIKATAENVAGLTKLQTFTQSELDNDNRLLSLKQSQQRLDMENFRAGHDKKTLAEQQLTESAMLKAINIGRHSSGKKAIESYAELLAVEKLGDKKLKEELSAQFSYGSSVMAEDRTLGDTPGQAGVAAVKMGLRSTPANMRAVAYMTAQLDTARNSGAGSGATGTAQEASIAAAINANNKLQAAAWDKNAEVGDQNSNPVRQPGVSVIAQLQPDFAVTKGFQEIFGAFQMTGQENVSAPVVMKSSLLQLHADPTKLEDHVRAISNYYTLSVGYNQKLGGVEAFKLTTSSRYNIPLDLVADPYKALSLQGSGKTPVDLTNPEQVRAYLVRSLKYLQIMQTTGGSGAHTYRQFIGAQ